MAIETIYKMKELPLSMALDFYKIMEESLEEKSKDKYYDLLTSLEYDFFNNYMDTNYIKWSYVDNNIKLTQEYIGLFDCTELALWICYAALELIVDCSGEERPPIQFFYWKKQCFCVVYYDGQIIFALPKELGMNMEE